MKILIIEDEAYVAQMLADSLSLEGHEPITALNAADGLTLLDREQPEAIFLDLVMPGVSGIEALRKIRERAPTLPVVVVTGYGTPRDIEEARRLGVADVIEKPFVLRRLESALGAISARRPRS